MFSMCYAKNILKKAHFAAAAYLKRLFDYTASLIKNNKTVVKRAVVPVTCALVLFAAVMIWSPLTLAVQVVYDGRYIGYAADKAVFEDACALMESRLGAGGEGAFSPSEPSFSLKIVNSNNVNSAAELCEGIVEASNGALLCASGLYVDGELVAVSQQTDRLQSAVDTFLESYEYEFPDADIDISNSVEIKNEYYLADTAAAFSADRMVLSDLFTVKVTRTEVFTNEIAYTTQQTTDDTKLIGYSAVKVAGVPGAEQVTAQVTYVNGQEISRDIVSSEIISPAVNETIIIGSKKFSEISYNSSEAYFSWPVSKAAYSGISAYWGDGRNHHGIDFAAPSGSAIYAAASGVVSFAGWQDNGYGYIIIVDHGDGYQTAYAHCDSIAVSVGQSVTCGEYIGGVGSTGRSTGPHLHFEVRINGTPYNPAPFLGISG